MRIPESGQIDRMYKVLFKNHDCSILPGPWVDKHQCPEYPFGCARFIYGKEKISMDFVTALDAMDVLCDLSYDDSDKEIWAILKDFENIKDDPWKKI